MGSRFFSLATVVSAALFCLVFAMFFVPYQTGYKWSPVSVTPRLHLLVVPQGISTCAVVSSDVEYHNYRVDAPARRCRVDRRSAAAAAAAAAAGRRGELFGAEGVRSGIAVVTRARGAR
jgi:hypothetical protein